MRKLDDIGKHTVEIHSPWIKKPFSHWFSSLSTIKRLGPFPQLYQSKDVDDVKRLSYLKVKILESSLFCAVIGPRMCSVNICLVACTPHILAPLSSMTASGSLSAVLKSKFVLLCMKQRRWWGRKWSPRGVSRERKNEPTFHWLLVTSSFCCLLESKSDISFPQLSPFGISC